jgi:biopolymer transport protein ExbB
MGIVRLLHQGGIFMVPLLFLSVIALAVVFNRTIFFAGLTWRGAELQARLRDHIRLGRIREALIFLSDHKGPAAATASAGLAQWAHGREAIENAMVLRSHAEFGQLNRFLMVLETIVTGAPLIGLLGTITGMMGVFRAVAEKMAASPQADTSGILAGIGEALVATATGIFLAVTCLFFHNFFTGLAETQMDATQGVVNAVLAAAEEEKRG